MIAPRFCALIWGVFGIRGVVLIFVILSHNSVSVLIVLPCCEIWHCGVVKLRR